MTLTDTVRRAVTGEAGQKLAERVSKGTASALRATAQQHWSSAVSEVQQVLNSPASRGLGGVDGGAKRVNFSSPLGRSWVKTPSYAPLSPDYVKATPQSHQFWNKTGRLAEAMAVVAAMSDSRVRLKTVGPAAEVGPGRFRVTHQMTFSRLPEPMDTYIRRSFIMRSPQGLAGYATVNRKDPLQTAVFPEQFGRRPRPVIGQIAARLGEKMAEDLQESFSKSVQERR